jgi:hypothetical protein
MIDCHGMPTLAHRTGMGLHPVRHRLGSASANDPSRFTGSVLDGRCVRSSPLE